MLEKKIDYGIKLIGAVSLGVALWGGINYYQSFINKSELKKEYLKNASENRSIPHNLYFPSEKDKKEHTKMCIGILGAALIGSYYSTKKYNKY